MAQRVALPSPVARPRSDAAAVRAHLLAAWAQVKESGAPSPLSARRHLLALILLRRLGDHYQEVAEQRLRHGASPAEAWEDRDAHAFWLPPLVRAVALRPADAPAPPELAAPLNQAAAVLAQVHPALRGIYADLDFRDLRAFGEAPRREATLRRLLRHLGELPLRDDALADAGDLPLALASGALVDRIAADVGDGASPGPLRALLVDLLAPRPGQRLCDPLCGVGGWLSACAARVARGRGRPLRLGAAPLDLALAGQEADPVTRALCQAHLVLCGVSDARIECGDTLRAPRLLRGGELLRFDRVAAVPPPRLASLTEAAAARDPLGRFTLGRGASQAVVGRGPFAVVLHALATLAPRGIAAVVLPLSALYRQGREAALRAALLTQDLVDAVIALPRGLLPGEPGPAAVLLVRRERPAERRGRVLLARLAATDQAGAPGLDPAAAARVVAAYHAFTDAGALVLARDALLATEANLSPERHLPPAPSAAPARPRAARAPARTPAALLAEARQLEAQRDALARQLDLRVAALLPVREEPDPAPGLDAAPAPPARPDREP